MLFYLFLLLTLVPLAEVLILVEIGQATRWWAPLLLVATTGIIGVALARWQGWQTIERMREEARSGRMPASAMIDGVLILVAGILLVVPGVITDVIGCVLLIPPLRAVIKRGATAWVRRNVEVRVGRVGAAFWPNGGGASRSFRDEIIEAKVLDQRIEDAR
jgi:UPF0716 protein FxsA